MQSSIMVRKTLIIYSFSYLILVSSLQDGACILRSCNQLVSGRNLQYGRALAIIRMQEYLDVVS